MGDMMQSEITSAQIDRVDQEEGEWVIGWSLNILFQKLKV
jgi:hypothetical protein